MARGGVKAGDGPMIPGLEAGFIWEESKEEPVVKGAWSVRKGGAGGGEENAPPGRCWVEGGKPEPPEVEPEVWVTGSSAGAKGRGKGGGARDS